MRERERRRGRGRKVDKETEREGELNDEIEKRERVREIENGETNMEKEKNTIQTDRKKLHEEYREERKKCK